MIKKLQPFNVGLRPDGETLRTDIHQYKLIHKRASGNILSHTR